MKTKKRPMMLLLIALALGFVFIGCGDMEQWQENEELLVQQQEPIEINNVDLDDIANNTLTPNLKAIDKIEVKIMESDEEAQNEADRINAISDRRFEEASVAERIALVEECQTEPCICTALLQYYRFRE